MQPKKEHYRGKLPHFQQPGQWYSVTIVLKGAMPKGAMEKYSTRLETAKNRYQSLVQKHTGQGLSQVPDRGVRNSPSRESDFPRSDNSDFGKSKSQLAKARKEYYLALRKYRLAYDKALHNSNQPKTNLIKENNRKVIEEALLFWQGKRLKNHAWCIMSNHIHWVFTVFEREQGVGVSNSDICDLGKSQSREPDFSKSGNTKPIYLQDILHSVKLFTAKQINQNENRSGQLWEHESFDTTIRNERHFAAVVNYALNNPVYAGLVKDWHDWPGCRTFGSWTF